MQTGVPSHPYFKRTSSCLQYVYNKGPSTKPQETIPVLITPVQGLTAIQAHSQVQYTDQEMIPARNARNVVTLAELMFVTTQCENILPSKITD
jgi:hypothetical protein